MEFKKFLLVAALLLVTNTQILRAQYRDNLVVIEDNSPIINREYRKIERKIERDSDNDEIIACEIEDNSCVPNDGESLGDSTKCCSGYANSRNICEGRQ